VRAGRGGGEGLPSGADRPEVLSRNALR
jgi:hypothetical protein